MYAHTCGRTAVPDLMMLSVTISTRCTREPDPPCGVQKRLRTMMLSSFTPCCCNTSMALIIVFPVPAEENRQSPSHCRILYTYRHVTAEVDCIKMLNRFFVWNTFIKLNCQSFTTMDTAKRTRGNSIFDQPR